MTRDRNRVLALFLDEEHSPVLEMALDNALALDLSIALERALTRLVTDHASAKEEAAFLRWYARFVAWLITEALLAILPPTTKKRLLYGNLRTTTRAGKRVQHLAENISNCTLTWPFSKNDSKAICPHLRAFES